MFWHFTYIYIYLLHYFHKPKALVNIFQALKQFIHITNDMFSHGFQRLPFDFPMQRGSCRALVTDRAGIVFHTAI